MFQKIRGIRWRLAALTILTLVPVFVAGLGLTTYFVLREQGVEIRKSEESLLQTAQSFLKGRVETARLDALFLASSPHIRELIRGGKWVGEQSDSEHLDELLSGFLDAKQIYGQLRILDAEGWERYRLDHKNGRAVRLPVERLQYKGERYYFMEAMIIGPGEVYTSRFDLNQEHGAIEFPLTSMLRFAAPVFQEDDAPGGVLVLNYYGDRLLGDLVQAMPQRDGFWVVVKADGTYVYHDREPGSLWSGPQAPDKGSDLFRDYSDQAAQMLKGRAAEVRIEDEAWLATPLQVRLGKSGETLTLIHLTARPTLVSVFQKISWLVFLVPFGALLSGLSIALYGGSAVSRPLRDLDRAMSGYASGERGLRAKVRSKDEIGKLSELFNEMAERLNLLYEDLENQVLRRTKELEWTNSQLARSEAVNAAIIDNTLEGIVSADLQGQILGFNKAAERIFGYPAEEVVGKNVTVLQPSPYREEHPSYLERYLHTGERRILGDGREVVGLRKDGTKFPLHLGVSEVVVGDQRFFTAVLRDLTAIRHAEQEFFRSEARFQATFDQAAVGMAHVGLDGSWLRINDRLCAIVDYPREELMNKTFQDITHPEDLDADLGLVAKVLSGEINEYSMEKRYFRKQGEIVWVNLTVSLLREDDGEPVYFISVLEDITERKRMDKVLRRTRVSVDRSGEGIYWIRPDGSFFDVNEGVVRQLGFQREEMLGMRIGDIDPNYDPDAWQELFRNNREVDGLRIETRHRRKNGELLPVEVVTYYQEFDGEEFLCCFVSDISQRKQAEQRLINAKNDSEKARALAESASQAKSNFLASMSHELRTPLNAIIGFGEVLQDEYFGRLTEKQGEYVGDILHSGHHLLALINDILELSKIEAGKMELQLSRFDLDLLLNTSLIYVREKAAKHGIELKLDMAEGLGWVRADERKIKQVVFNLLSNAAKFTPDGGTITMAAHREDLEAARLLVPERLRGSMDEAGEKWILVSVQDTGIGLDESDLQAVFDEFYQVKTGRTGKTPGTGLGLSLSAQMLKLQGGVIWAESRGEGYGSRFTFVFPEITWDIDRPEEVEE